MHQNRWPAHLNRGTLAGRLACLLLVAGAVGLAGSARPSLAQTDADGGWVPLTVIYTSDIKGKIEPCG